MVKIKNAVGADQHRQYFGSDISAPMFMKASAGSGLPSSPSARLNTMMQLMSSPLPIVDLPEIWKHLQDAGYIDSASALEKRMTSYVTTNKQNLWMAPALMQLIMGGAKKKNKGGSKSGNSGRSARNRTPSLGMRAA
jgi:hypothetical protein